MYKSFDLLKKISFERVSGTKEEHIVSDILVEEVKSFGVDVTKEEFDVDGYEIKEASLSFIDPDIEVSCVGVGKSGNTPCEGLIKQLVIIESLADLEVKDVNDKIVFIANNLIAHKTYKGLVEKGASGIILASGSLDRDIKETDNDPYKYRDRHYNLKQIPAVCIKIQEADKILQNPPKMAKIVLRQDEFINKSYNVVATIEGTEKKDEIIVFTAHYDSVPYSSGAYDNGSGTTAVMQILEYYSKHLPKRTLKFVFCASEEMGLLGSKDYVIKHKDELEKFKLCINIDMIGVTIGYDFACVTGDVSIVNYLEYFSKINGFGLTIDRRVYSSDSTPFADNNVPAISFARLAPRGGATIHSRLDRISNLSENNYYRTIDFIINFSNSLVNCHTFPVKKEMPEDMKLLIDKYLLRKE